MKTIEHKVWNFPTLILCVTCLDIKHWIKHVLELCLSLKIIGLCLIMKIYASSDQHFGHGNNIRGTSNWSDISKCRPFNTVEEHDEAVINNTNELVMPDDTLYLLGDFTVGTGSGSLKMKKSDAYIYYRNKINCKNIIYIRGNHSLKKQELRELGIFSSVHDYLEITYNKKLICMFHYPIAEWNSASHGSIMIHGHSHGNYKSNGRIIDVGLDTNNFKPYLLDGIIDSMSKIQIKNIGHH